MTSQPIPLNELDVIGYADVLPEGKGPAAVPPVFRHRAEADRCYVPPFRLTGNWLVEARCVSFSELQELEGDESITLPGDFTHPALPDYQLWVDEAGVVRYEPAGDARRAQQQIHQRYLEAAISALREGRFQDARRDAGVALAASDRALEPRALIAASHALRGQTAQATFMRKSAVQAGLNGDSFTLLLKNYLESIPPETWEKAELNVERVLDTCKQMGADVWVPFHFTEEDFRRFRPILHQFRRAGGEREFTISCPGVEAILMGERETIRMACNNAEEHIQDVQRKNVLAVAAETMLNGTREIAEMCQKEEPVVRRLGGMLRRQVQVTILRPA